MLRVKALGGGVAVQFRMYFQGELYTKMYGQPKTQLPPIKKMLAMGIPVGMGTDAPRISTYNPWMAIHWLLTGKNHRRASILAKKNKYWINSLHYSYTPQVVPGFQETKS